MASLERERQGKGGGAYRLCQSVSRVKNTADQFKFHFFHVPYFICEKKTPLFWHIITRVIVNIIVRHVLHIWAINMPLDMMVELRWSIIKSHTGLVYTKTLLQCHSIQFWMQSQVQSMQNWNDSNWHTVKGLGKTSVTSNSPFQGGRGRSRSLPGETITDAIWNQEIPPHSHPAPK